MAEERKDQEDRQEQEERAADLREEIDRLKGRGRADSADREEPPRSPRDFIEERMKELDEAPDGDCEP